MKKCWRRLCHILFFSYNAVEVDEENAGIYGNIGILIASTYELY